MNIFKKLFGGKKKDKTEISFEILGKKYSYEFDAPPEVVDEAIAEFVKQPKYFESDKDIAWRGKNEVELKRDDGYLVYKRYKTNSYEQFQVGFLGFKMYSENGKYCVVSSKDNDNDKNLALVDCTKKEVLYAIKVNKPYDTNVSNEGIVCCQLLGENTNSVRVFDLDGSLIAKRNHKYSVQSNLIFDQDRKQLVYIVDDNTQRLSYQVIEK